MLHVALLSPVYPPEPVASAQIAQHLAQHMAAEGHHPTVLCQYPSRPMGAKYPGLDRRSQSRLVRQGGVDVVYLPTYVCPESRLVGRLRENVSYGRQACGYVERYLSCTDAIYANVGAFFSASIVSRLASRLEVPLVLHIQDVYPEALSSKLSALIMSFLKPALRVWDRRISNAAHKVVVISSNMQRVYSESRRVPEERLVLIHNWQSEWLFERLPDRSEGCARYSVPSDEFTFMYLGNIGPVAGVRFLIDAFHSARLSRAQLVIAGDGSEKAACVQHAISLGARDVRFISDPDVNNVPLLQSMADVCLLPVKKGGAMYSIPSKLIAYLFSGKPVLCMVDELSDTARCVKEAECGWIGEAEDVAWLAGRMIEVAAMPDEDLRAMGARGRAYGFKRFSKREGVQQLAQVVLEAARRHRHRGNGVDGLMPC